MWLEWVFLGGVILSLLVLLKVLRMLKARYRWSHELARKAMHMIMGLTCLSFYWLFDHAYMVWILAVAASALLLWVRYKSPLSTVLHGVKRQSYGEVYFALSVALIFTLADEATLYLMPLLVLTFSDTAAALIGQRYGQMKFTTRDGEKSVEGSAAFAVVTFFLVAFSLALLTDLAAINVLLMATILALLITLIEGASWQGIDNLLIPFATYLLLVQFIEMNPAALMMHLMTMLATLILFLWLRKHTLLDGSALLAVVLTGYFSFTLGGLAWLLAAAAYFVIYTWLALRSGENQRHIHSIDAYFGVTSTQLLALVVYQFDPQPMWFELWVFAFGCQLALTGLARNVTDQPQSLIWIASKTWLQGWVYIWLPFHLWHWDFSMAWMSLLLMALANGLFLLWQPKNEPMHRDRTRWLKQGTTANLASLCYMVMVYGW